MLDLMVDINDGQLGTIQPEEVPAFEAWTSSSHEGAAIEIDAAVKELVESDRLSLERAQHLFVRMVEMSFDACCIETQLLALGVAAGARVLAHRKADENQHAGLWLARTQNVQKLLKTVLSEEDVT